MVNELEALILEKFNTRVAFALTVGFTKQKLNKVIRGLYVPKVSEAKRMAAALGVDVEVIANFFS